MQKFFRSPGLAVLITAAAALCCAPVSPAEAKVPPELSPELRKKAVDLKNRQTAVREFMKAGKFAEAEQEFLSLLTVMEQKPGADHPETLMFRYHLALCLKMEKKFADAEKQARLARDGARKNWGPAHPNTLLLEKMLAELQLSKP